jgi:serine protease inhibitor
MGRQGMGKVKIIMIIAITLALVTSAVSYGCSGGISSNPPLTGSLPAVSAEESDKMVEDIGAGLVDANTEFAFSMFRKLAGEDAGQNIFISPLSILLALAMTYNGAVGETADAMADAMEFSGMEMEELNRGFSNLIISIINADSDVEISIANSIWQRSDFKPEKDFIDTNKKYYNSEVRKLDFSKADAPDVINSWISDATREKITKMIDRIPQDAVMYLINAIYFKGDWTYPFEEDATFDDDFYHADGSTKKVPMMHMQQHFQYGKGDGFAVIRLPYGQEKLAMYVMLPDKGVDIDSLLYDMDQEKWNSVISGLSDTEVSLAMPKYRMEYGIKTLNDALTSLGMGIAFTPDADFSAISKGIFISRVLHKAVIEVNEKGSEAAAATVVEMVESAMPMEEIVEFIVDRPYLFTISDDRTGSIMFMGKVMDPGQLE